MTTWERGLNSGSCVFLLFVKLAQSAEKDFDAPWRFKFPPKIGLGSAPTGNLRTDHAVGSVPSHLPSSWRDCSRSSSPLRPFLLIPGGHGSDGECGNGGWWPSTGQTGEGGDDGRSVAVKWLCPVSCVCLFSRNGA